MSEKGLFFGARLLKELKQTGHYGSKVRDRGRKALASGKRISSTGHEYWETRKNRSDSIEGDL